MNKVNTAPEYNAGDMLDIATLAHEHIEWLEVGITDILKEMQHTKSDLVKRDANNQFYFYTLEKKLEITQYLLMMFKNSYESKVEEYTAERNSEGQA